ncbi:MAG: hypothetical protein NT158_07890 [Cyanobacteria bacterium]|nr:hypothetical protein [Cyanobacteriota bacterium]
MPELGAAITLEKRIPLGAGLAGGSSDAAATLLALQVLWGIALEPAALMDLAAALGSDVPYCLEGGLQLSFGRGERLEPADALAERSLGVLLVTLKSQSALPPLRNDLQSVVAPEVPSVGRALGLLRQAPGALAVAMSGSGPSVFALFDDGTGAERAAAILAEPLAAEGFAWWCTRTRASGVSLEADSSAP